MEPEVFEKLRAYRDFLIDKRDVSFSMAREYVGGSMPMPTHHVAYLAARVKFDELFPEVKDDRE